MASGAAGATGTNGQAVSRTWELPAASRTSSVSRQATAIGRGWQLPTALATIPALQTTDAVVVGQTWQAPTASSSSPAGLAREAGVTSYEMSAAGDVAQELTASQTDLEFEAGG